MWGQRGIDLGTYVIHRCLWDLCPVLRGIAKCQAVSTTEIVIASSHACFSQTTYSESTFHLPSLISNFSMELKNQILEPCIELRDIVVTFLRFQSPVSLSTLSFRADIHHSTILRYFPERSINNGKSMSRESPYIFSYNIFHSFINFTYICNSFYN